MSHNAEAGPSRGRTRTESHSRISQTVRYDKRPQLGHLASWSVSSHKYGYGVDNLRDDNDATYWQSEGPQPHLIDLSFPKRVLISAVSILTSHPGDDSYTPSKLSVQCGTTVHDLQEVRLCDFHQPDGWQHIALRPMDSSEREIEGPPISAFHLRIVVLANHLNGKDTHVRGLKVFGAPAGSAHLLSGNIGGSAGAVSAGEENVDDESDDAASDSASPDDFVEMVSGTGTRTGNRGSKGGVSAQHAGAGPRGQARNSGMDIDSPAHGAPVHSGSAIATTAAAAAAGGMSTGTDAGAAESVEAKVRREKRERKMRRLLKKGGPDKIGYTTRAFKMHEVIR